MECKICGSKTRDFNIGKTPIAGYVVNTLEDSFKQPKFKLEFMFCDKCIFGQYGITEGSEEIYNSIYSQQQSTYGISHSINEYLEKFANDTILRYNIDSDKLICEVGCNDGMLLKRFKDKTNCNVIGIEPSKSFSEVWKENNIDVINDYLSSKILKSISSYPDIVIIRHVLEHIDNIEAFMGALHSMIKPETVVIVEVPHLTTIINKNRIDNMGHQHVNYFSGKSLSNLFEKYSLYIKNVNLVDTDGGSILVEFTNNRFFNNSFKKVDELSVEEIEEFIKNIDKKKKEIHEELNRVKVKGKKIIGYGGGPKGQHLVHLFGLEEYIEVVLNDITFFHRKYIPGTAIQYISPKMIELDQNYVVVNLAPTHTNLIRAKVPSTVELINII